MPGEIGEYLIELDYEQSETAISPERSAVAVISASRMLRQFVSPSFRRTFNASALAQYTIVVADDLRDNGLLEV